MEPKFNFDNGKETPREALTVKVARLLALEPLSFAQHTPAEFLALSKEAQRDAVTVILDAITFNLTDTQGPALSPELKSELIDKKIKLLNGAVDAGILRPTEAQVYMQGEMQSVK